MDLARARFATMAVFFANGLCIGGWSASIAPLKRLFGLSDGGLSLILLAFAAGAVVSMPLAGAVAPRLGGAGRVTGRAGLAFALSFAAPWFSSTPGALAVAAVLLGATNGLMDVSMNAHASDIERRWGAPIMSSFHAAFSVGGLGGAALGALLLRQGVGPQLMLSGVGSVALVVTALSLTNLGEGMRPKGAGPPLGWPERAFVALAAAAFLCFLVEGAMVDWSGVYLVSRGADVVAGSFGFAAFSATMVLGRLVGDLVVARLGRRMTVAGGAAAAGVGLALATVFPSFPAIVLGFALVGTGLANVVPVIFTLSARRASNPARGVAAAATAGYSGLIAGPPFVGAIASFSDLRVGIAALAVTALVAAAISAATL